jgi:hypothetical protein
MNVRIPLGVVVVGVVALAAACGPSAEEIFAKHRPAFSARRADLAEIAKLLPAPGSAGEPEEKRFLDPAPICDEPARKSNVEFLMEPQLADPDADEATVGLDLRLSGEFLLGLKWTGPKSPLRSFEGDPEALDLDLSAGLARRWLIVTRVLRHDPPVALDAEHFEQGFARFETWLVDLPGKSVLGGFGWEARTSEQVNFAYREGEDKQARLEAWAKSSLWENARKELFRILSEFTNGTFVLN